jgi:hypothetical protein
MRLNNLARGGSHIQFASTRGSKTSRSLACREWILSYMKSISYDQRCVRKLLVLRRKIVSPTPAEKQCRICASNFLILAIMNKILLQITENRGLILDLLWRAACEHRRMLSLMSPQLSETGTLLAFGSAALLISFVMRRLLKGSVRTLKHSPKAPLKPQGISVK